MNAVPQPLDAGTAAAESLSAPREPTPHDVTIAHALAAIRNHRGPILVDLDETLYLRNSTEDFIDTVRPRTLALLLLRALDALRPWRWTGGELTRDVWRVRLILSVFPRTLLHWQHRVTALAAEHRNTRLWCALVGPMTSVPGAARRLRADSPDAPVVATVGFLPIVAPLVAALGLPRARIVGVRVWHFGDRLAGKLRLTQAALGEAVVGRALVITDSEQDSELLDACAQPLRVVWPEAHFRAALSSVYLPGQYLSRVKRPGERYIVRGILQEDFAFWLIASLALAAAPLPLHVAGLTLLLLSFWTVYERGYVDNDQVAARFEAEPKLSAAFHAAPVATPAVTPWLWALASGAAGAVLLRWPDAPTLGDALAWTAVLVATHAGFALYNRCDKGTRVWLFAGLQFARSAAFVALVPIVPIGAMALGAHVLARWVPYHVYRLGGRAWPNAPLPLIRLLFFAVLAVLLALAQGPAVLWNGTALALLAWNLYRARQELAAAWGTASRIDRPPPDRTDRTDRTDPADRSEPRATPP